MPKQVRVVRWVYPLGGFKLNTDGSSILNPGPCGGGGVVRDWVGNFVYGYTMSFGEGTNTITEVLALLYGLKACVVHSWFPLTHGIRITHIYIEGNKVADCLAKLASSLGDFEYWFLHQLPREARAALRLDKMEVPYISHESIDSLFIDLLQYENDSFGLIYLNPFDPISLSDNDEANEWLIGLTLEDQRAEDELVFQNDSLTWGDVARSSGADEMSFSPALSREFRPYKPNPAPLLHICSTWDIRPSEVMMVGDSLKDDIACGKEAGAVTCLLDEIGRYNSSDFVDLKPDFKVSSLVEVFSLLEANFELNPQPQGV
ncbi:hypothetical protein GIB67_006510 [Kingdonia uniflora]|uniref:RNase H type-1 domain-containing protein n=1 Tax=Kingdonia uniflora TaxID=39325 RepID=A0A7J7LEL0_9MAGN|nr:hypothetical protein GIB67_006510 [Kingdonia uniflora]